MEDGRLLALYEQIMKSARGVVALRGESDICKNKNALVIGSRLHVFSKLIEKRSNVEGARTIVIGQPEMLKETQHIYNDRVTAITWEKRYTEDLLETVQGEHFDAMYIFGIDIMDVSNMNLWNIAHKLCENMPVRVYCYTKGEQLFEYTNLELFIQSVKAYMDMNRFISEGNSLDCVPAKIFDKWSGCQ